MNYGVGNRTAAQIQTALNGKKLLPDTVTLTYAQQKAAVAASDLGLRQDGSGEVAQAIKISHTTNVLPLVSIFQRHAISSPLSIDTTVFNNKATQLQDTFKQSAKNATLSIQNGSAQIENGTDGYTLDVAALKITLIKDVALGQSTITVPVHTIPPTVGTKDLSAAQQKINQQVKIALNYSYQGKKVSPSAQDVGSWFAPSGSTYTLSDTAIGNYLMSIIGQLSVQPQNLQDGIAQTKTALGAVQPLNFSFAAAAKTKTINYCAALKDVAPSNLPTLEAMLKNTYGDIRGWGLNGQVTFKQVGQGSGCDLTVWLSAASDMPSFGAICDTTWSCTVKPYVIINYDRWQNASPAWQQYGGSLEDYRHMVINHETGHWLGFNHSQCSRAGQLAPVMQQQSINLQGCAFNPWPLPVEQTMERSYLGL
jgi:hypothetical protein